MNKCAASADEVTTCLDFAFRSSEIIRLLRRLRDACGAEQIGETHQAVIKADLNRAIQSVMRANTEFRQNFRREEQRACDGRHEVWEMMNYAIADVIRADRAFHIALALHHGKKAAQTQGATHND